MGTHVISEEEIMEIDPDFMDEEDTEPLLLLTVQEQINSATSVAEFAAAGRAREVVPVTEMPWTDRLDFELDDIDLVDVIGLELG